jgi:hypothetical protein
MGCVVVEVAVSLWLPVGRSNFFNLVADQPMFVAASADGRAVWQAESATETPQLQVSVLRRLVQVLPRGFGYDPSAVCIMSPDLGDGARPVSVTMTVHADGGPNPDEYAAAAATRQALADAAMSRVALTVDEYGFYTFRAELSEPTDAEALETATVGLRRHVLDVLGGEFQVERLRLPGPGERWKAGDEGIAAIRRYAGLNPSGTHSARPPMGILNFFQLNLVAEGLCNESLLPAVYFEHYQFVEDWQAQPHRAAPIVRTIGQLATLLTIDADATSAGAGTEAKIAALHRFLSVTSRETLQRLKWSVESARRSLLDEMLGSTHRQTRLVQLNLGASPILRTPELAEQANESQLRGYIMLVDAKLPLIANAGTIIDLAVANLKRLSAASSNRPHAGLAPIDELATMRDHWQSLLHSVRTNIDHLDRAVTHEWRERMLYEQEQTRAEQEAIAEIERGHGSRFDPRRVGDGAYNAIMMILTVLAVLYAVRSYDQARPTTPHEWMLLLADLWPIAVASILFYLLVPSYGLARRWWQEQRGSSETYSYEYAIRIDENTTAERINAYLNAGRRRRLHHRAFPGLRLVHRGNGRIETISPAAFVFKIHSVVVFRASWNRYARFEVVHEILARSIAGRDHYVLRQSRVFGDSPRALCAPRQIALARTILDHTVAPLITGGSFDNDRLPQLVTAAYEPPTRTRQKASGAGHRTPPEKPTHAQPGLRPPRQRSGDVATPQRQRPS